MTHAGYIGRVGALAVALGVGVAVATAPGIAHAQPSDSGAAWSPSDSTSPSPATDGSSAGEGATGSGGSDDADSPASVPESVPNSSGSSSQTTVGGGGGPAAVISSSGGANANADDDEDAEDVSPSAGDEDAPPAGTDDDPAAELASGHDADSAAGSGGSAGSVPHESSTADDIESIAADSEQATESDEQPVEALSDSPDADDPEQIPSAAAQAADDLESASVAVAPAPAPTVWSIADDMVNTVVNVATQLVSAVVTQLHTTLPSQNDNPLLWMMASVARREVENLFGITLPDLPAAAADGSGYRLMGPNGAVALSAEEVAALTAADATQHVLMIGVDGTNMSRILVDQYNQEFFGLMEDGTTGVSSIAGHSTVSNPSWTAMLTGVWNETTGVVNNTFTPWVYDRFPTVFNMLEGADPSIQTTVIADWRVIAQIAAAGENHADKIVYFPQVGSDEYIALTGDEFAGLDEHWDVTDDAVGAASVEAINNTEVGVPSFQFTYFVGVDNNGHQYLGGSHEYAMAIRNVNDNIGLIMEAVENREKNFGEDWTVLMVTDHGHYSGVNPLDEFLLEGRGHGFQSPDETSTWIIASGPDFEDGAINSTYEIVDMTPTILDLFDVDPQDYFQGASLLSKSGDDVVPPGDLQAAISASIEPFYVYPDPITVTLLDIRTIVATIPYYVDDTLFGLNESLDELTEIPVLGSVVEVVKVALNVVLGGVVYEALNIPAQVVMQLTGVTGADIIPPDLFARLTGSGPATLTTFSPEACGGTFGATCVGG